jgi:hypothetical protein
VRAVAVGIFIVPLLGCDQRPVGISSSILPDADEIVVKARGTICTTLKERGQRDRVAAIIREYPTWEVVAECRTPSCNDIVVDWKTGNLTVAEIGICGNWVTINVPGPQGCGRKVSSRRADDLLAALGLAPGANGAPECADPDR